MLIFEKSVPGRCANSQQLLLQQEKLDIPKEFLRKSVLRLPEVSELQVVRHYSRLSQKNFGIETHFYPLGSCSMKYNPRVTHRLALLPGFANRHPYTLEQASQGFLSCIYELREILKQVTGMQGISLTPMAGSQGEFAGLAIIRAYHHANGGEHRNQVLVADSAHGTNPASAVMCGYGVKEVPTGKQGDIDLAALEKLVNENTAAIMLTNPSTLGIFDRNIKEVTRIVHQAGALCYYDGANLNAILGKVRPGDMGFDVMHINLHKTFATPHGGGGPGAGPVAVMEKLMPFLPVPRIAKKQNYYGWLTEKDCPQTIGRLSGFMGNSGVLLRAYVYTKMLGFTGMRRVSEYATLNANYLMKKLQAAGFTLAFPKRRAGHEFIITLKPELKKYGVSALDFAKRLMDYGFHPPTIYFPLLIPECFLIEPTETESKQELDRFVAAMQSILKEAKESPDKLRYAPYTLPVRRVDEVKAARELDLVWVKE